MLRRSHVLLLIVALPFLVVIVARIIGPGQLPPLRERLNEYVNSGNFQTSDNQLVWNATHDFLAGTRFDNRVAINSPHRADAINIYVVNDDPKRYFQDEKCNCRYLGQDNTIVCDGRLFRYFTSLINIDHDDLGDGASFLGSQSEDVIFNINANFRFFMYKWIIGHEIGHLVLEHGKDSNSMTVHENEVQADQFVIEHLDLQRSSDLAWVWLGLSNVISAMYDTIQLVPGEGTPFPTMEVVDRPNAHPSWLVRLVEMGLLLLQTYPNDVIDKSGYFEALQESFHKVAEGQVTPLPCDAATVDLTAAPGNPADLVVLEETTVTASDAWFYLQQGAKYRRLTEYEAAIASLTVGIDALIESKAGASGPPSELLVQAYVERGTVYFVLGEYGKAMSDWETVAALQPDNPVAHNNLGFAHFALGESGEATTWWRKAVDRDPSLADSWAGLGITLYDEGQVDAGIADYERALAIEPGYGSLEWLRYEASWPDVALRSAAALLSSIERS